MPRFERDIPDSFADRGDSEYREYAPRRREVEREDPDVERAVAHAEWLERVKRERLRDLKGE